MSSEPGTGAIHLRGVEIQVRQHLEVGFLLQVAPLEGARQVSLGGKNDHFAQAIGETSQGRSLFFERGVNGVCPMIVGQITPFVSGIQDPPQLLDTARELLGIRLLDHVIVGDEYYSFADAGTL